MIPKEYKRIAGVGLSIAEVSMNAAKKSIRRGHSCTLHLELSTHTSRKK